MVNGINGTVNPPSRIISSSNDQPEQQHQTYSSLSNITEITNRASGIPSSAEAREQAHPKPRVEGGSSLTIAFDRLGISETEPCNRDKVLAKGLTVDNQEYVKQLRADIFNTLVKKGKYDVVKLFLENGMDADS